MKMFLFWSSGKKQHTYANERSENKMKGSVNIQVTPFQLYKIQPKILFEGLLLNLDRSSIIIFIENPIFSIVKIRCLT